MESGTLVTQKTEPAAEQPVLESQEKVQAEIEEKAGENFTPETIIDEDQLLSGEKKIEDEGNISFHEEVPVLPEENIEETIAEEPVNTEVKDNETAEASEEEQPVEELSDAEVSFHGTDSFMPDVKIQANNEEISETAEVSQSNVNKHEDEMRRLIEEVEKKMKEAKPASQEGKAEPEVIEDHEISFAETQNFHFWSTSEDKPEEIKEEPVQKEVVEDKLPVEEVKAEVVEKEEEQEQEGAPEVQSAWKPMSVESNMPDSLISKSTEVSAPEIKAPAAEVIPEPELLIEESKPEETVEAVKEKVLPSEETGDIESSEEEKTTAEVAKEAAPVMNVSFFGTDISTLKVEEKQQEIKEEAVENVQEVSMKNTTQAIADSNVPGFINTWQSWLKIDRTEEIVKEKAEIKEKAIETFIENNPRISQLKEESTYVVKEKNDDISHLMTETLANLYFEQKLYTKAIKAFEILIRKSPGKKEYFESKIQDIKDFRSKN